MDLQNTTDCVTIDATDTPTNLMKDVSQAHKNVRKPGVFGLSGIQNTGNTCYMNSAIQALSHIYILTYDLFTNKDKILSVLKTNAPKFFKEDAKFNIETSEKDTIIPLTLRQKLASDTYDPKDLTTEEETLIYTHTITFNIIKLLENLWNKNCKINPVSFRRVFTEVRNKFFFGYQQHDAEEAYSCIIQKMQEELSETKNIKFKNSNLSVIEFMKFKDKINAQMIATKDPSVQLALYKEYIAKKKEFPLDALTIEAYREMRKYYGNSYCKITEIFSGIMYSSITCPRADCSYTSNKFEAFLHLSLPMANSSNLTYGLGANINLDDCLEEYCKEELLDENNLWNCESCNNKVPGVKRLQLWSTPPVLVIQLKRFSATRTIKDSRLVSYPLKDFNIGKYVSAAKIDKSMCTSYRLQSVINHTGTMQGGHYFTYCLDDDTGDWYKYDDIDVSKISTEHVVNKNAYLLFYTRKDLLKE